MPKPTHKGATTWASDEGYCADQTIPISAGRAPAMNRKAPVDGKGQSVTTEGIRGGGVTNPVELSQSLFVADVEWMGWRVVQEEQANE